ncbi:MAG: hypothetical protein OEW97_02260 [Gammaproteobacteria bacterium]|nr:hypothetical protein [Gammaproteobacteria bacterium]MDH5659411.1 hypothetical protein [Gammaproteobacteria bacterium]
MKKLNEYPIAELKIIYSVLHNQVMEHPALMDSNLLQDLQTFLQSAATLAKVDVSTHADWANWLKN